MCYSGSLAAICSLCWGSIPSGPQTAGFLAKIAHECVAVPLLYGSVRLSLAVGGVGGCGWVSGAVVCGCMPLSVAAACLVDIGACVQSRRPPQDVVWVETAVPAVPVPQTTTTVRPVKEEPELPPAFDPPYARYTSSINWNPVACLSGAQTGGATSSVEPGC